MRILFVCTGNTCRSPMAALITKSRLKARGLPWSVKSAGVSAVAGVPISPEAAAALERRSIEVDHVSQPLDEKLVSEADIILTMTAGHRQHVIRQFPQAADKTFELLRYISDEGSQSSAGCDIVDPFGGTAEDYETCARKLEEAIDVLLNKLEANAEIDRLTSRDDQA
ncbi:low molecular weight protein arginine phosphatase [Alicyclobacillus cycloheptanicus]|uniref:Protein-tyrosine-phosphatase n=1 Tax=Alicyclobacillus cycloheptanicus TaxID=1457 RepID=A0ABT9XHC8_9BACL|nr:low molecular weight protein arginine phosphatase [Alicyclobacillus cycloheptanicus]MDQ0189439.1 protein-tyrosine-phosphatase [Alicyclobacillus cycloheptanicus]